MSGIVVTTAAVGKGPVVTVGGAFRGAARVVPAVSLVSSPG